MAATAAEIPLRTENQREMVFAHRPLAALAFGIIVLGIAYYLYASELIDMESARKGFSGFMGFMGLLGLLGFFWRFSLNINLLSRTYKAERGFLPFVRKWNGTLDDLSGVVLTSKVVSEGKDNTTRTVWIVSLDLKGLKAPASVYVGDEMEAYEGYEHLAGKLRVNAIDRTGLEERKTRWDELDRPVSAQEHGDPGPIQPPPGNSGIQYREGPVMIILPPAGFFSFWLLMLLIALPFVAMGLLALLMPVFSPENVSGDLATGKVLGLIFSLVGAVLSAVSIAGMTGRQVVTESPGSLEHAVRLPGNRLVFRKSMPKREIEEVSIKPILKQQGIEKQKYEVFVRSDKVVLHIWRRNSPEELRWLRDAVLCLARR